MIEGDSWSVPSQRETGESGVSKRVGASDWPRTAASGCNTPQRSMASLAGWTGYWIDRLTFPYARPHELLAASEDAADHGTPHAVEADQGLACIGFSYGAEQAMLRRSIIIAACVVGICLGA